ncbi:MAG: hypothetical protein HC925_05080 [Coleofasciculaceae cyanobacterium SM2_3_26]|nr:hypothetical protein [Coleofasciculaceae cyanobacterium SM2_3_26]
MGRFDRAYTIKFFGKVAIVAIAYWMSAQIAIHLLDLGAQASPIWLAAGIALTATLVWGRRMWVGIFIGDFLLMQVLGAPWLFCFSSAAGSALAAVTGLPCYGWCSFR